MSTESLDEMRKKLENIAFPKWREHFSDGSEDSRIILAQAILLLMEEKERELPDKS